MPRVNKTGMKLERQRLKDKKLFTGSLIRMRMKIEQIGKSEVSVKAKIAPRTVDYRIQYPETLRLGELWSMLDLLQFNDEELLKILRGGDYIMEKSPAAATARGL